MRILHIGDIAQQASYLASAQRRMGHQAIVMAHGIDAATFGLQTPDVDIDVRHGFLYPLSWNRFILRRRGFIRSCDVVHAHGGLRSWQFAYGFLDVPLVAHLHGTETREGFGLHHLGLAESILYSTPDLADYLPSRARWLPQAVPELAHEPASLDTLRILHAPTDPRKKDTQRILEVIGRLFPEIRWTPSARDRLGRGDGVQVRVTTGPVSHPTLISLIAESNLVIDHLGASPTVGITSIEAMRMERAAAAGFSVDTYRHVLKEYGYTRPPMFHIDGPASLEELLRRLWTHPAEIGAYLEEAKTYAAAVHDPLTVAQTALAVYAKAIA